MKELTRPQSRRVIAENKIWEPVAFVVIDNKLYRIKYWALWSLIFIANGAIPGIAATTACYRLMSLKVYESLVIGSFVTVAVLAFVQHILLKKLAAFSLILNKDGEEHLKKMPWVARERFFGATFTGYFGAFTVGLFWSLVALALSQAKTF